LWKEPRKMFVEFRAPGDDHRYGICHGFVDIAGC
jgi:hypothetical protein